MNYLSPLSLFKPSQLSEIKKGNIKSLKKEILLYFQLDDSATIKLNEKEYDKNEILKIFDALNTDLDFHLSIIENKDLLNFLEKGDLRVFKKALHYDLEINEEYYDRTIDLMIDKCRKLVTDAVSDIDGSSVYTLSVISSFAFNLEPDQIMRVYDNAYLTLEDLINDYSSIDQVFASTYSSDFSDEIHAAVSRSLLKAFAYLPESFETLEREYAIWCNNTVVVMGIQKENRISKHSMSNLKTLRAAAEIASRYHNEEGNRKIVLTIDDVLHGTMAGEDSNLVWIIFVIVKLIIVFSAVLKG